MMVPQFHDPDAPGYGYPRFDSDPMTDYELVVGILIVCGVKFWEFPEPDGPCALAGPGRSPAWLAYFAQSGDFIGLYANARRPDAARIFKTFQRAAGEEVA